MDDRRHEWDLLEQAHPDSPVPFGFVCCCGEVVVGGFRTIREAVRAAGTHAEKLAHQPAA